MVSVMKMGKALGQVKGWSEGFCSLSGLVILAPPT